MFSNVKIEFEFEFETSKSPVTDRDKSKTGKNWSDAAKQGHDETDGVRVVLLVSVLGSIRRRRIFFGFGADQQKLFRTETCLIRNQFHLLFKPVSFIIQASFIFYGDNESYYVWMFSKVKSHRKKYLPNVLVNPVKNI